MPIFAASLIAVGIAISAYGFLVVREPTPSQVPPVSSFTGEQTSKPSINPSASPSSEPTYDYASYAVYPRSGARIGTITLPTLKLSWPIYQGTSDAELAKGVGHYAKSVLPGQNDNSVLSGHRTTVFNRLGQLKRGQLILVKTSAGVFTYKIRAFRVVLKTDRTVIVPTSHAVLTLTTCYPFNNLGATTHAYVVSADLQK